MAPKVRPEHEDPVVTALKAERKALRAAFSSAFTKFNQAISEKDAAAGRYLLQLKDKHARLKVKDGELQVLRRTEMDAAQLENEFKTCEEYHDKMTAAEFAMTTATGTAQESPAGSKEKHVYRLPKLVLQAFDLGPKTWLPFWAQYQPIYENQDLGINEKFQYLLMSLKEGSRAREMMVAFPQDTYNFEKAIDSLKARFGREEVMVEVYTRELLGLVLQHSLTLGPLFDKVSTLLRALEGLGMTSDKCAFVFYPLVESCLPPELLKVWERRRLERAAPSTSSSRISVNSEVNNEFNPLEELMSFLAEEVRAEERIQLANRPMTSEEPKQMTAAVLVSTSEETRRRSYSNNTSSHTNTCLFCDKNHASQDCTRAQNMSYEERNEVVQKKSACFRCLKRGHRSVQCRTMVRCVLCHRAHYVLMCRDRQKDRKEKLPLDKEHVKVKDKDKDKSLVCFSGEQRPPTYLKTMLVEVVTGCASVVVRALLDDAAHRSYIAEDVVNKLNLRPDSTEFITHGLFGGVQGNASMYKVYNIKIRGLHSSSTHDVSAVGQGTICDNLMSPSPTRDPELFSDLKKRGIILTDVGEHPPPVQLMLGADVLGSLLTGTIHTLPNGIAAVETKMGWAVLGKSMKKANAMISLCMNVFSLPQTWELESLGIKEPMMPPSPQKEIDDALVHFKNTVKRSDEGRFVIELPWLAGHAPLNDNLDIAVSRLHNVSTRLKKDGFYEAYDQVFREWENEGIISVVSTEEDDDNDQRHYLAHRPVIKMERASTKVRPVFDASVKKAGCASLNQCLNKGPNLLQNIPPLILKFRQGAYGVTSDVKQAFLQLVVADKDRDMLRFLWWDEDGKRKIFRHNRVVFGVSCSPFLLNAVIQHHLEEELVSNPANKQVVEKLKESFYVDDSVISVDTRDELDSFMQVSQEVMARGKFELRRWVSNARWVPREDDTTSVLGMKWNLRDDVIYCVGLGERNETKPLTKRILLSIVNAVYDPIGLVCPAMLTPRLLLQVAWKLELQWDDTLPPDIHKLYNAWACHLNVMERIRIPRRLSAAPLTPENSSLHVFADASQKAYGCCIYLLQEHGGQSTVQLVAAKARVAPLQDTTIPRLELLAACVAVRLCHSLKSAFGCDLKTTFWTDSMTVLAWVTKALPWATFVGNRVREIRSGSDVASWRHVPGLMNPADVASRGCSFDELMRMKWWEGPAWLKDKAEWPKHEVQCTKEALIELKAAPKAELCMVTVQDTAAKFSSLLTKRISSYSRLIRVSAWIGRFFHNCTKEDPRKSGPLTAEELNSAETRILKLIQMESVAELGKENSVNTHTDTDGVLRVTSRVVDKNRETSLVLLPSKHDIVTLLIRHTHRSMQHAGVGTTLATLRDKYWVIRGRKTVRTVVADCRVCRRLMSKRCEAPGTALPVARTSLNVVAFQVTGVDLFGPLYLRDDVKVWGILFTCAVYRCVHLDLVNSLSTESFIRALRRFLARNSNVQTIISDNGTNFKGLSNLLHEIDWDAVTDFVTGRRLEMLQNPPAAPWWGGFFERLVGVVKSCLRKQVGNASLTYEELQTIFCECEAVVNSRPLTYVSEDVRDFSPITPAHFLRESPGEGVPELDVVDAQSLNDRVRYVQKIREDLRSRFSREYLSLLVSKGKDKQSKLGVGDIVLVEAEGKKRLQWPLARILELYPGKDGVARVAKVKTKLGELVRPIQRLFPLELSCAKGLEEKEVGVSNLEAAPQQEKEGEVVVPNVDKVRNINTTQPEDEAKVAVPDNDVGNSNVPQSVSTRSGRCVKAPSRLDL